MVFFEANDVPALINALEFNAPLKASEVYAEAFEKVLHDTSIDNSLKAEN